MRGSVLHPFRNSATVINVSRRASKLRAYVSNKSVDIATPLIVVEAISWLTGLQSSPACNQGADNPAIAVTRRTL